MYNKKVMQILKIKSAKLGFHFGIPSVVMPGAMSLLNAFIYSLGIGLVNLLMILSHSYSQNSTTMFLTSLGCLVWLFWGAAIAFVSV